MKQGKGGVTGGPGGGPRCRLCGSEDRGLKSDHLRHVYLPAREARLDPGHFRPRLTPEESRLLARGENDLCQSRRACRRRQRARAAAALKARAPTPDHGPRVEAEAMAQTAGRAAKDRATARAAQAIVEAFRRRPPEGVPRDVAALFRFARYAIAHVDSPASAEVLASPEVVARRGWGDTRERAAWLAAHLLAAGHEVRFVLAAVSPHAEFHHVYTQVALPKAFKPWVSLDPTYADEPGKCPADYARLGFVPVGVMVEQSRRKPPGGGAHVG